MNRNEMNLEFQEILKDSNQFLTNIPVIPKVKVAKSYEIQIIMKQTGTK